jgi:hypothetical protein
MNTVTLDTSSELDHRSVGTIVESGTGHGFAFGLPYQVVPHENLADEQDHDE